MRDSLQLIKSMFQTAEGLSKQVRESPPYDALLSLLDQALERVHFVQVGAHDGTSNDRLWPFITRKHWTGMMVEPHPDSFRSLQMLCANDFPRLTIVNKAITNRKGAVELIEPDTPFGSQTATIEPSSGWARYRPSKRTFTVDGITLAELLAQHSVDRIDVLQVDTEGHDFEVVKTLDFSVLRPTVICYEDRHLFPPGKRREAINHLQALGYSLLPGLPPDDTLAVDMDALCALGTTLPHGRRCAPLSSGSLPHLKGVALQAGA